MAIDVYLQIYGIKGESMDETHRDWIECATAHFGVHQPRSATASTGCPHRRARTYGRYFLYEGGRPKDWGPTLLRAGFHEVQVDNLTDFRPQRGDVAVIQATTHRTSGHIQGFDGVNWTSDFVQVHGFWPGAEYRTEKPAYVIYRP
jgi:hypothetical protein